MKNAFVIIALMISSGSAFASGLGYNGQCPDISGTFRGTAGGESSESSFTRADVDGNLAYRDEGGQLWVIDGQVHSNEGYGTIQLACENGVLHKITVSPGPGGRDIKMDQTYAIGSDGSLMIGPWGLVMHKVQ